MKMKKVLSLVLGGAMALSMLAGCSSTSSTGSTDEAATEVAQTATYNTAVVAEIEATWTTSDVGSAQYNTDLTGNEATDLSYAVKQIANGNFTHMEYQEAEALLKDPTSGYYFRRVALLKASTKTVIIVPKDDGVTDANVGQAIVNALKNGTSVNYRIAKLSVFDAELSYNAAKTLGIDVTVSGTSVDFSKTEEYWVIVVTTAADQSVVDYGTF